MTAAVATPPPAPWTSTASPSPMRPFVVSMRYAVSQAVGRQAASAKVSSAGLGTRLAAGTVTRSATVPWYFSDRIDHAPSGRTITAYTTTSPPSGPVPAASQPRIIGNWSARSPTPRSDHRSWRLSELALTSTTAQPSGTLGSGASPMVRPARGSASLRLVAKAARMPRTLTPLGGGLPVPGFGDRGRDGRGDPVVQRARHDAVRPEVGRRHLGDRDGGG